MIPQSLVAIGISKEIFGEIEDKNDFHQTHLLVNGQDISREVAKITSNKSADEVIFLLASPFEEAAKVLHRMGYYVVVDGNKLIDGVPTKEIVDVASAYDLINELGFSLSLEADTESEVVKEIDIFELESLLGNLGSPHGPEEEREFEKIEAIKDIANRGARPFPPLDESPDDLDDLSSFSSLGLENVIEALDTVGAVDETEALDTVGAVDETPQVNFEPSFPEALIKDSSLAPSDGEMDFVSLFDEFTSLPVFTEQQVTQPPATQPPATQPPATQPPATQPPATPDLSDVDDRLNDLINQYKAPIVSVPEKPQPKRTRTRKATVIAMFIAKGGTGKTSVSYTLAARLASVLSKNGNKRVAFLDANRGNADVAGYLGLDLARVSTLSAIASEPFITDDILSRIVYKDPLCNLDVFFSPSEADDQNAKLVRVDLYREVLAVLAEKYDYVFIDTPAAPGITGPEDEMDARLFTDFILPDANLLVGIITPSQPLINRTIKLFQVLTQPKYQGIGHGLDRAKIGVLLNRYKYTPGKGSLSEEDIRSQLASWAWWGRIPEIDEWQNYINIGNSQVTNPEVIKYIDPILFKLTRESSFSEIESHSGKSPVLGRLFSRKKK